jgi:transposase
MLTLPSSVRIYLATQPVDMRKSFDGLSIQVRLLLEQDPLSGHLFVFLNRTRTQVKVLWFHAGGFCLFSKRMEKGCFRLPQPLPVEGGALTLEPVQLALLLEGIDLQTVVKRPRWEPRPGQSVA